MIVAIHAVSILVGLGCLGLLAGRFRRDLRAMRLPLSLLLLATVTANGSELAEWSGIADVARFGEMLAILVPVAWLFTLSAGGLERALRRFEERERQLRLVFDHAVVPLALVDQQGRHIACSTEWARWREVDGCADGRPLPQESALGRPLCELLRTCLETGEQAVSSEPVAVTLGDRVEWAQLVVAPWLEGDERPGGALAMGWGSRRRRGSGCGPGFGPSRCPGCGCAWGTCGRHPWPMWTPCTCGAPPTSWGPRPSRCGSAAA